MTQNRQTIYDKMDELAVHLRASGSFDLAKVILHRVHEVTWTTRSELLQELRTVLVNALETEHDLPATLKGETQEALLAVEKELSTLVPSG